MRPHATEGSAMTGDTPRTLTDDDIRTAWPTPSTAASDPQDADGADADGADADESDGDATDTSDGDAADGDAGDADGTDA